MLAPHAPPARPCLQLGSWAAEQPAAAPPLQELGPEILPLEYGGAAAEVTVEAAVQQLPAWQQRRQQQRGAAEEGAAAVQQGEAAAPQPAAASSLPAVGSLRLSESASVLAAPV